MTKKRQRVGYAASASVTSPVSSTAAVIVDSSSSAATAPTAVSSSPDADKTPTGIPPHSFPDSSPPDVVLRLFVDSAPGELPSPPLETVLHLHSHVLRRCKYFSALLSDRWSTTASADTVQLNLGIPSTIDSGIRVLKLLYTGDFAAVIDSAETALDLLPVALELIFDECVRSCVKFLEAVPWSEEEESRVLNLIPLLGGDFESEELLARVSPGEKDSPEEMLQGLIVSAIHSHPNMAFVKAFVAKLMRDFSTRDSARRVLEKAFRESLRVVRESLEEYSSPNFRGVGEHHETEAVQRLNLHTAMTNGKHLVWLVERMIELRVADSAVEDWSCQASFTADLQWAFHDGAWKNIVPGLPSVILRCTLKLAGAVAGGTVLASKQVRKKLVKSWLPVLIVCKDNVLPLSPSNKTLYSDLEETFLRIISTLPMGDAQELLQQCLSFSTRNVEDCPHLVTAFNTWFRRAAHPPLPTDNL